jgi:hypothetical protein
MGGSSNIFTTAVGNTRVVHIINGLYEDMCICHNIEYDVNSRAREREVVEGGCT